MKRPFLLTLLCVSAVLLLGGCNDSPDYRAYRLPAPTGSRALVCFYRDRKYEGSGVAYHIRDEGREVGVLNAGRFFYVNVTPGEHEFESHGFISKAGRAYLYAKAGQTYYVKADFATGLLAAELTLNIMNEDEGRSMLHRLKLQDGFAGGR